MHRQVSATGRSGGDGLSLDGQNQPSQPEAILPNQELGRPTNQTRLGKRKIGFGEKELGSSLSSQANTGAAEVLATQSPRLVSEDDREVAEQSEGPAVKRLKLTAGQPELVAMVNSLLAKLFTQETALRSKLALIAAKMARGQPLQEQELRAFHGRLGDELVSLGESKEWSEDWLAEVWHLFNQIESLGRAESAIQEALEKMIWARFKGAEYGYYRKVQAGLERVFVEYPQAKDSWLGNALEGRADLQSIALMQFMEWTGDGHLVNLDESPTEKVQRVTAIIILAAELQRSEDKASAVTLYRQLLYSAKRTQALALYVEAIERFKVKESLSKWFAEQDESLEKLIEERAADLAPYDRAEEKLTEWEKSVPSAHTAQFIADRLRSWLSTRGAQVDLGEEWDRKDWPALLAALVTVGNALSDHGKAQDGLTLFQQGTELCQSLINNGQGSREVKAFLVRLLTDTGNVLRSQRKWAEALPALNRSIETLEQLLQSDPDNKLLQEGLAATLNQAGFALQSQADWPKALAAVERSVQIQEQLVQSDPDNKLLQTNLATTLSNAGSMSRLLDKSAEAQAAIERSLQIRQEMLQGDPDNEKLQESLAGSLHQAGVVLQSQGKWDEALTAFKRSIEATEQLLQSDPKNKQLQQNLATTLYQAGLVLQSQGEREKALTSFKRSIEALEPLLQSDPKNKQLQEQLATTLHQAGLVFPLLGKSADALRAFERSIQIRQQLLLSDRDNKQLQQNLAATLHKAGSVLQSEGEWAKALAAFDRCLQIRQQLLQSDPDNKLLQQRLAVTLYRAGLMSRSLGQSAEAQAAIERSIQMIQQLLQSDPDDKELQEVLAAMLNNAGLVLQSEGKSADGAGSV